MAHLDDLKVEELANLPSLKHEHSPSSASFDEKTSKSDDMEVITSPTDHLSSKGSYTDTDSDVVLVNGEPVIRTGRDVSRYLIDIRDDGESALTFRSLFLGTVFAGLGAALCQVSSLRLDCQTVLPTCYARRYTCSNPCR